MKTKLLIVIAAGLFMLGTGCSKDNEGCTDINADNYDTQAEVNKGCTYRYAISVTVGGVPAAKPSGESWDIEGGMPDLKIVFAKNESGHVDVITSTAENTQSATLSLPAEVQLTNGDWKYDLLDDDIGLPEVIASGHFNPLKDGSAGTVKIINGTIAITFNYVVK